MKCTKCIKYKKYTKCMKRMNRIKTIMKKLSESENIVVANGIKLVIWYLIIESQN